MGKAIKKKRCKFCGQLFFKPKGLNNKRWGEKQFCSKGCANRFRGGRFEEKFCPYCGIKMEPRSNQSPASFNNQKFCSRSCRAKFYRIGIFKPKEQHWNWKGGEYVTGQGYRKTNKGKGKYEYEHRLKMEKSIKRELRKDEVVHHINGNRLDNRIENLEIMTAGEHARLHQTGAKHSAKTIQKLKEMRAGTNQKECHQQWKPEITEESICGALRKYGTQKRAAAFLGICRQTLWARLKHYQKTEVTLHGCQGT